MRFISKAVIGLFFCFALVCPLSAITIDEICSRLTAYSVTTGDFAQEKTAKALKRPLKSFGKFRIDEKGIIWDTQKPFKSKMIVSKTKITQISADGKETSIDSGENQVFAEVADTISAVFSGDKTALEAKFGVEVNDDGKNWRMKLSPKDKTIQSAITSIEMTGKIEGSEADSVLITQASGDTIRYTFSNHAHNAF